MKRLLLLVATAAALSASATDFVALYGAKPDQIQKELGAFVDPNASPRVIKTEGGTFYLQFNHGGRLGHFSYTLKKAVSPMGAEKMLRGEWGLAVCLDAVKKLSTANGDAWLDIPGKVRSIKLEKNGEGLVCAIHISYRIGWDDRYTERSVRE